MTKNEISVKDLVTLFGGDLYGNDSLVIKEFKDISEGSTNSASFVTSGSINNDVNKCESSLLIVCPSLQGLEVLIKARDTQKYATLVHKNPKLVFAKCSKLLTTISHTVQCSIHPKATIHTSVVLGKGVKIGPNVVIEEGSTIGSNTEIKAGSFIGNEVMIGNNCLIHPNVTINNDVVVGDSSIINSGSVIGGGGFGFSQDSTKAWHKIPQTGGVVISENVEIGANTTIDSGTFNPTVIGKGVKIDNLVHIAHNVTVCANTIIAGCVGIAGSAHIGEACQIGGAAGILDHVKIPDNSVIGPMTLVMSSIKTSGSYVGVYPMQEKMKWKKSAVFLKNLGYKNNEQKHS
ncbi:UDP-3-O-(3-hydroxymyristoyl)glucosamine N-acyltransferase [Betaproteobacteria bacterium]|nr:UDP-3-O-(3-hydroxymyristoyl)glucosamine N-acyltransferase [Betaproteobacteria bacterium]